MLTVVVTTLACTPAAYHATACRSQMTSELHSHTSCVAALRFSVHVTQPGKQIATNATVEPILATLTLSINVQRNVKPLTLHPFLYLILKSKTCIGRESNPGHPRGRRVFYH